MLTNGRLFKQTLRDNIRDKKAKHKAADGLLRSLEVDSRIAQGAKHPANLAIKGKRKIFLGDDPLHRTDRDEWSSRATTT